MPHATACATAACQCFVLPKPACALLYSRSFVPCSTASRYVNESQYYIIYILCVEILNIYLFIFTAACKCFALPQPENALHNLSTPMPCGTAAANSLRCCSLQVPCATAAHQYPALPQPANALLYPSLPMPCTTVPDIAFFYLSTPMHWATTARQWLVLLQPVSTLCYCSPPVP